MVTSQGNYSIELHRDSPKSLPILPNLLHLPSQTVKVREYYRLRVEIPGLARFGDIVTPS